MEINYVKFVQAMRRLVEKDVLIVNMKMGKINVLNAEMIIYL